MIKLNCQKCGRPIEVIEYEYYDFRKGPYYCSDCYENYNKEEHEKFEKSKRVVKKDCNSCNGTGRINGYKCMTCDGSGKVNETLHEYSGNIFFHPRKGRNIE